MVFRTVVTSALVISGWGWRLRVAFVSAVLALLGLAWCHLLPARLVYAAAATPAILVDTVWSKANSPYLVTNSVAVYSPATLTIEPGVRVLFAPDTGLSVRGRLVAKGTAADPIVFTTSGTDNGLSAWSGILVDNAQSGSAAFSHIDVSNAAAGVQRTCCLQRTAFVTITDSIFHNNSAALSGYGGYNGRLAVLRTTFENNSVAVAGGGDAAFVGVTFRDNTLGLSGVESTLACGSTFSGHSVAVSGANGAWVIDARLTDNDVAVQTAGYHEGVTLRDSEVDHNGIGLFTWGNGNATLAAPSNNSFHDNRTWNLRLDGTEDLEAGGNWWGSANPVVIDAAILDGRDPVEAGIPPRGLAHWSPALSSPPVPPSPVDCTDMLNQWGYQAVLAALTPTPTPTATGTATWTPTVTSTSTATPTPTSTATATPSPTVTATSTSTATVTATATATVTATPNGSATATNTATPTATAATATPTRTATTTPTGTASPTPTFTPAPTRTFVVDTTTDAVDDNPGDGLCHTAAGQCSLRAAVMESNVLPGAQAITLAAGTYTLTIPGADENFAATGDLDVIDHLAITGASWSDTFIQACDAPQQLADCPAGHGIADRIFDVYATGSLKLTGMTLRHGRVQSAGGAIRSAGSLNFSHVKINQNMARSAGGAVYHGGCCATGVTLTYTDGELVSNQSNDYGGALFATYSSTLLRLSVSNNTASGNGGGINAAAIASITDSAFSGNSAYYGGGVYNSGSRLEITTTTITSNTARQGGGGLATVGGTTTLVSSTVSGNSVTGTGFGSAYGGGIAAQSAFTMVGSTVSGNTASSGGGVEAQARAEVIDSTITGNAASTGAGIHTTASSGVFLASSTVAFNTGPGLTMDTISTPITLKNTIVAGNTGGECQGVLTSSGYNLTQGACPFIGDTTGNRRGDPLLGPLAANGGPTLTHLLGSGSPAIDAGNPAGCTDATGAVLTTDQRGQIRAMGGGCDIGAVETLSAVTPTPTPTQTATLTPTATATRTATVTRTPTATATPASQVTLRVDPASGTTGLNSTPTDVRIVVDAGARQVDAAQFRLTFDPAKLQVVDADPATGGVQVVQAAVFGQSLANAVDNALGTIDFAAGRSSAQPAATGAFTLATFRVVGIAEGSSPLTFDAGRVQVAFAGQPLQAALSGGTVRVTPRMLVFTQRPVRGAAGFALGYQPEVRLMDGSGNLLSGDSTTVVALGLSGGAAGAALACATNPVVLTAGIAVFTGCSIDTPGADYVLQATALGADPALSPAFNVTLAGDTNGDCKVTVLDFSLVVTHFGKTSASADWTVGNPAPYRADLNGSGAVSILDFSMVVTKFGASVASCPMPSNGAQGP